MKFVHFFIFFLSLLARKITADYTYAYFKPVVLSFFPNMQMFHHISEWHTHFQDCLNRRIIEMLFIEKSAKSLKKYPQ